MCLKSFFKVRHGLGVDFLIETDNFLNILSGDFPGIFCIFSKTFLVTKRVAVGAFGAFPLRIAVIFQADADFEVKSGVVSYF